jgi:antirestriction protein ArdC
MDMQRLYQEVTDTILEQLQAGCLPWRRDWSLTPDANVPCNAATGRAYNGVNVLLLWVANQKHGWKSMRFVTFRQAQQLGGSVRGGQKSTGVVFMKKLKIEDKDHPGETKEIPLLRGYRVFNIDQSDGLPESVVTPAAKKPRNKDTRADYQDADAFLTSTRADIREGAGDPAYCSAGDYITLPRFVDFDNGDAFFAAAFHECGHWTGHKSRLNRDLKSRFGDLHAYCAEELVAELCAAFLCAEFSTVGDLRHAGYIGHWIKLLKHDARAFFTAANKAQQAADYLRHHALAEQPQAV